MHHSSDSFILLIVVRAYPATGGYAEALPGGCFYDLIPQDWPQRKKFLAAMKLPKHLSEDLKQHLK